MEVLFYNDRKLEDLCDHHLEGLVNLFRKVWDKDASKELFLKNREKDFQENPYMEEHGFPLALLIQNGNVVGHCNSTPCKIFANGSEYPLFWNSGLYLDKIVRGQGRGIVLPKLLTERLPIISGFFVVPQQLRTHEKLGYHIIGKIPDYIKILNFEKLYNELNFDQFKGIPTFVIKFKNYKIIRPAITITSALFRFYSLVRNSTKIDVRTKDYSIKFVKRFDDRVDQLWEKNRKLLKFAQVRNSDYMNWQFKYDAGWSKIIIQKDDIVCGFAIVVCKEFKNERRLGKLKIVSTIDFFWDFSMKDIIPSYLSFIEKYAKREKAALMSFSINEKNAQKWLIGSGYIKIPETVQFVVKSSVPDVKLSACREDWFFTRGDADAAGALRPSI